MAISKTQLAAMLLLIFCFQSAIFSQAAHCSQAAAEKADYEASRIRTWDGLYHSYLRYSGCDDGSIAEGYDDSVIRLVAHHWNALSQAFPSFADNTGFYRFVIRHINETAVDDDLKMIRANSIRSCPAGGNTFCLEIREAASRALHLRK